MAGRSSVNGLAGASGNEQDVRASIRNTINQSNSGVTAQTSAIVASMSGLTLPAGQTAAGTGVVGLAA